MTDYEKLKELEDKVHDLQWRMNQVCNLLMFEENPVKPEECEHESDGSRSRKGAMPCQYFLATKDTPPEDVWFQCKKCRYMYQCEHEPREWDNKMLVAYPSGTPRKCKKCGEFYV